MKKLKKQVCGATGCNLQVTSDKTTQFWCPIYTRVHKNGKLE